MSTNLTAVLQQLLQNTTNLKVLRQLMTPDAVYVPLNFNNPELKKIEPWAGTHNGPEALPKVFAGLLALETSGQQLVLDFRDVTLVNEDAVKFLGRCEADGIKLENCPLHVRKWIDQLKD